MLFAKATAKRKKMGKDSEYRLLMLGVRILTLEARVILTVFWNDDLFS